MLFAVGASAFEAGDQGWGMIGLQRATLEQPGSEGGDRAELRLVDWSVIKDNARGLAPAIPRYVRLGRESRHRQVREEASFKAALGFYLLREYRDSVNELMDFRRNFSSSSLRREADLLLQEQLPRLIDQLVADKRDLEAVVLVEKNRNLLLDSGFDRAFLADVATAFGRLGLYQRAGRVLLYLFDRTAGRPEQQALYLPLAQSYLKRAEYGPAGDYAERYLSSSPRGEDAGGLFAVLLEAFAGQGRDRELLTWLDKKDRPRTVQLERRAAGLYWKLGRWAAVADSLEWISRTTGQLEVKEMALLAEAYYQLDDTRAAADIYQRLQDDPGYAVQARYRSAQILLQRQQRQPALKLLAQAVETDSESPWGKLARDLLIQEKR